MKKLIKRNDTGWDMGEAIRVLAKRKTPYGFVYVVEVVNIRTNRFGKLVRRRGWIEGFTHKRLKACIGPDCEGDLPPSHLFRKK